MRKSNPTVRVLLSVLLLGLMVYFFRQQKTQAPALKTLAAGAPMEENSVLFAWVPRYPGAALGSISTRRTAGQTSYAFQFETKGEFAPVLAYYEAQLESAGFKVTQKSGAYGAQLHAEDASRSRWIDVSAGKAEGVSEIDVTANAKNGNSP